MAFIDTFHDNVKTALEKDGWTITHDPLYLRIELVQIYIDLGAEKIIAAEKGSKKIAVEVKSFLAPSTISEFHTALGQFINYRCALAESEPERILYLAVSLNAQTTFFQQRFIQTVIQSVSVKLLVFDPTNDSIVRWIN